MSNSLVVVVATIVARDGHTATVEKALLEAVVATRQEAGCIEYALHRQNEAPSAFVIFERWHDDAALAAHSKAAAFQALAKVLEGRADLRVEKLTQIA